MIIASRFIAVRHHTERRVVPILFYDTFTFFPHETSDRLSITNRCRLVCPAAALHLKIKSHLVSYCKCYFRRTPGVESYMIQAMLPGRLKDFFPVGFVH